MTAIAGLPLSFNATVSGNGCASQPTFSWSFGDGNSSNEASPVHSYVSAGDKSWTFAASADGFTCSRSGVLVARTAPPVPQLFVPAVAHAPGAEGTSWRTDLVVVNLSGRRADFTVAFTPYGGGPQLTESTSLGTGESTEWEDVLVSLFGFADGVGVKGTLRIAASAVLHVHARTFTQSQSGTFGQYIPALAEGNCMDSSDRGIVAQLRSGPGFRSNVGFLNGTATDCAVDVSLHDGGGNAVGSSQTWVIPAGRYWQRDDVFTAFNAGNHGLASLRAHVTTQGCRLWAYGSVIDNVSSDPTTVPVLFLPNRGPYTLAAIAHAPGAGGTTWRSDIATVNPGDQAVMAQLSFHPYGGGSPITRGATLAPGSTTLWKDVLVSLFNLAVNDSAKGAVRIEADARLMLTARTANESPTGSFGQYLPAIDASAALTPPRVGVIAGLKKSSRYRSNLGVLNPGAVDTTVLIRLFHASGRQLGNSLNRTIPPATYWQQDDIFSGVGAAAEPLAYATVQVTPPGSSVWAYGSVVDNTTGDPTTVPVLDSSTIGTTADLSGTYEVLIGPAPGFTAAVDHDGDTVTVIINGKDLELTGEGQLDGRAVSFSSFIFNDYRIVFDVEFSRDGQSFRGEWRGLDEPSMDGTITGTRSPLAAWDLASHPPPPIVEHIGIDLEKIERISRFRSGAGHDFSDDFENCRSMKHYYQGWPEVDRSTIVVYAPFDGTVIGTTNEYDDEGLWKGIAIGIRSVVNPAFSMTYFHIDLDEEMQIGDIVTAGQRLGNSAKRSGTASDFVMRVVTPDGHRLISYFQAMDDQLFSAFEARGVTSRDDLMITRDERDADPLTCVGQEFVDEGNLENYLWLNRP